MRSPVTLDAYQALVKSIADGKVCLVIFTNQSELALLEEINHDVRIKEAFIQRTVSQLKDIHLSYNTQLAQKQVYEKALSLFGPVR